MNTKGIRVTKKRRKNFSCIRPLAIVGAASVATLISTGCGIESFSSTAPIVAPAFKGLVMGGRNPIIGATVKIYASGDSSGLNGTGYGVATALQEANKVGASAGQDTDANGYFNFAGGYSCPAGQFVYIVSAGGNTGANSVNSAAVLVAPLGRCEDVFSGSTYTGTFVVVDEVTTVAAAYALGSFATVSGTGASTVVSIGAPGTNNATTGSTTAAAGLRHAFQNAINLVTTSNGLARTVSLSNSSALVPQALIHTIANTVLSCVNGSGPSSGGCPTFFQATTVGGAPPTNTFSALINLAKNPTLNGTSVTVASFQNLGASANSSFYSPNLSAAPTNYSIAITYPSGIGATTGVQGLTHPTALALDANDVLYVGNQSGSTSTQSNLASFNSAGALLSFTTNNILVPKVADVEADSIGHIYQITTLATTPALRFTASSGVVSNLSPISITASGGTVGSLAGAVDRANNLWFTLNSNAVANLYRVDVSGITATATTASVDPIPKGIGVDPDQNIWLAASDPTKQNFLFVYENTGLSASAPAYSGTLFKSSQLPGKDTQGIAFVFDTGAAGYLGYQTADKLGPSAGLQWATPTITGATLTNLTSAGSFNSNTFSSPIGVAADGTGKLFAAESTLNTIIGTTPGTTAVATALTPCKPSGTTCVNPLSGPTSVVIDSTGAIWANSPATGSLVQIIGTATPVWPLLSLGRVGEP